jgi:NTP pyrophosphatase (non-canonical NTP hydrolase)
MLNILFRVHLKKKLKKNEKKNYKKKPHACA